MSQMRRFIRRCVALGPRSGGVLLREALKRTVRRDDRGVGLPLFGCRRVVFVCHGNVLRSPFAAGLLARLAGENGARYLAISSAGLRARVGRPADPRGIEAAAAYDVDLGAHHARLLTRALVRDADAVVVMDFANQADFLARFPESRAKLRLLGAYDPMPRTTMEIVDPYMLDAAGVRASYDEIARCIERLCAASGFAAYARASTPTSSPDASAGAIKPPLGAGPPAAGAARPLAR